jgi:hypothetical protein
MKVEIIKNENNKPIGWSMTGENREEINKLINIRNLQFIGINDTAIRYAGRSGGNDKDFNPGTLSWKQSKYIKH